MNTLNKSVYYCCFLWGVLLLSCEYQIHSKSSEKGKIAPLEVRDTYSISQDSSPENAEYNFLKRIIFSGKIHGLHIDTLDKSIFLDGKYNEPNNEPLLFLEYRLLFSTSNCLSIVIRHMNDRFYFVNYQFEKGEYFINELGPRLLKVSIDSTASDYLYDFESEYGLMGNTFNTRRFYIQDHNQCPNLASMFELSSSRGSSELGSIIIKEIGTEGVFIKQIFDTDDSLSIYKLNGNRFVRQ